jgi:DNA-binding MarR family transcriptional regulator
MRVGTIDRNALYHLSLLQRKTRAWFVEKIADDDITVPMFSVMFEIDMGPDDVTSSELARRAYVSAQTVNLVVQQLVERGYVSRRPTGRGRRLALTLTAEGKVLLARLCAAQNDIVDAMVRHAGVEERELRALLIDLIASVDKSRAESNAIQAPETEGAFSS